MTDGAERKLQESEERLRLILDSAAEAIYGIDLKGYCTFCNKACIRMMGFKREEDLIGRNMHETIHYKYLDGTPFPIDKCRIFRAFRTGELVHVDDEVLWRADGTSFCAEYWSYPQVHNGAIVGAVVTVLDITERKRNEELLRCDKDRQQALLELSQKAELSANEIARYAMEAGIKLTGSKIGYIAFVNDDETVLTMQYWSRTAMEECAISDKPIVYPLKDTGLWGEAVRRREAVITNDYAAPNPAKRGVPEGHVRLIRHMNIPVFDGKRIAAVAGVGNKETDYTEADVTQLTLMMEGMWRIVQRKKTEELLKKQELIMLEMGKISQVGAWELDISTNELTWTEENYKIHEVDMDYHPTFERLMSFYDESTHQVIRDVIGRARKYGESFDIELEMNTAKNNKKWVRAIGKAYIENERTTKIYGTVQDITRQKNVEIDIKAKISELERFQKVTMGREKMVIELKKKIKELEDKR